jgi:hypothetical protein
MMRSRRRQRRRASNEKLAGAETMENGASRTAFERNADSKFDAVLADANQRGHAQIDSRADRGRPGKPGRPCRIPRRFTAIAASRVLECELREIAARPGCVAYRSAGGLGRDRVDWASDRSGGERSRGAPAGDSCLWIAWILGELRGERKFLVDRRPFAALAYCTFVVPDRMIRARRWQRRRASYEKLAARTARVSSGASRAARSKKRRYEVRRRNGRRKVARTLADRILVLTKAGRGNLDGFVASCALRHAKIVEPAARRACGMRDFRRNVVDSAKFLWMRAPEGLHARDAAVMMRARRPSRRPRAARSSPASIGSRKAPAPRRRYRRDDIRRPPGRPIGEDKRRSILAHHEAARLTPGGFVASPKTL